MTSVELSVLKNALLIVGLEEVKAYKNLPDEEFEFSSEFEQKIKEINKKRKSLLFRATKTVPRRIALVLVAVIMTFCLMMTISAIRIPVVNFFVNIYEEFIGIFFEEEENVYIPETIEKVHEPSYMIDGYQKIDVVQFRDYAETYWEKDTNLILLYQETIEEELKTYIDSKDIDYLQLISNNKTIYYWTKKGECVFMWTNDYYIFTLVLPENTPLEEAQKIINSMDY